MPTTYYLFALSFIQPTFLCAMLFHLIIINNEYRLLSFAETSQLALYLLIVCYCLNETGNSIFIHSSIKWVIIEKKLLPFLPLKMISFFLFLFLFFFLFLPTRVYDYDACTRMISVCKMFNLSSHITRYVSSTFRFF